MHRPFHRVQRVSVVAAPAEGCEGSDVVDDPNASPPCDRRGELQHAHKRQVELALGAVELLLAPEIVRCRAKLGGSSRPSSHQALGSETRRYLPDTRPSSHVVSGAARDAVTLWGPAHTLARLRAEQFLGVF